MYKCWNSFMSLCIDKCVLEWRLLEKPDTDRQRATERRLCFVPCSFSCFFSFLFVSFFRLVHCRSWLVYQDWFMPVHLVGGHRQNVVGRIVDAVYDWYDLCREYSGWDWSWVGLESLNARRIIFSSEFAMVWGCLVL